MNNYIAYICGNTIVYKWPLSNYVLYAIMVHVISVNKTYINDKVIQALLIKTENLLSPINKKAAGMHSYHR